ncbi:hypothetical protein [Pseudomonas sp.]|uniref:hypothetical protein n=1 Tax=Pseudomonas sp. TaxID=306 RepID=UPI003262E1D2
MNPAMRVVEKRDFSLMHLGDRVHWENNRGHSSMQINQQKTVQVDVTELHLYIKVRDGFAAGLKDAQGEEVGSYEGYVPDFFPGDHYGDYLILNIDLETGAIKNWKKPTADDIEKMLAQGEDD